ncbi:hypothetical protein D1007_06280 [Hordeum vulgare]|nr:hypothetical protein D1007_06280 [Hordeum vulgare]
MDHFNVPEQWRMQVEHTPSKKAMDAWRNWKHVLYKKYLSEGKDPILAYPQITKAVWAELKRVTATEEFTKNSARQSELQKRNTHPRRMGVAGYYDMKLIWDRLPRSLEDSTGTQGHVHILSDAIETKETLAVQRV